MELSAAWPAEAGLKSFHRTVTLTERGLRLDDCCTGGYRRAELYLLTCEKPDVKQGCVFVGTHGELHVEGASERIRVETVPVADMRLRSVWPAEIYRIAIPFTRRVAVEVR